MWQCPSTSKACSSWTTPLLTVPTGFTIECDQEIVYDNATATDASDISVEVDTIPANMSQLLAIVRRGRRLWQQLRATSR